MEQDELVGQIAEEGRDLWQMLTDRLGADWFTGQGGTTFEVTPRGAVMIESGDLVFFRDRETGLPVASRRRGNAIEFATVLEDGEFEWWKLPPRMGVRVANMN